MQFENEFEVGSPIDTVWSTLLDVEQVAPCMPGAEVLEQTGDNTYKVSIKIRLGPVSMQYRGDVEIVDTDPGAHQGKIVAKATEARGQGTANAEIQMRLTEREGKTHATLSTDLRLSGRAAAMGQGIVKDVASKLTETFAECLAAKLEGAPVGAAVAESAASAATRPHEVAAAPPPVPEPSDAAAPLGEEEVPSTLDREDVEAATEGFTTPDRSEALKTQPEVPSVSPEQEAVEAEAEVEVETKAKAAPPGPSPSPQPPAELPALEIAVSVVADRLRKPRVLAGAVAAVFVVGFVVGRLGRG